MSIVGCYEVPSKGWYYTWSNKAEGDRRVYSKLDRAIGNGEWMDWYAGIEVQVLYPSVSNHSPLLMVCKQSELTGGRPFRFFNYLADHSAFSTTVVDSWVEKVQENPLYVIWQKLKNLKCSFKKLHHKEFSGIHTRIQ